MAKNLELSGMIHAAFGSETKMAKEMGWSRQRLNRITTGKKIPDLFEVNEIATVLKSPFIAVAQIFLRSESTIVDKTMQEVTP